MDKILANGLRVRTYVQTDETDTKTKSSICLMIPSGENQEGSHRPQSAHACEHLCCAFNGGFPKPYAFLELREKYGIRFSASTHAEYTKYCLTNIPNSAIPLAVRFIYGIFHPSGLQSANVERELSVIRNELHGTEPNEGLTWAYAYWVRQGDKRPTPDAILHRGVTKITPESVIAFHREHYQPSRCVLVLTTPSMSSSSWDREFMSNMNERTSWAFPVSATRPLRCSACAPLEGVWMVPSTRQWIICSRAFKASRGKEYLAEIRARCLISACSRLSGTTNKDDMTLLDYLRSQLGATYHVSGSVIPLTDGMGNTIYITTLVANLSRHLTRSEAMDCDVIIDNHCSKLPGRGALNNLTAWFIRNQNDSLTKEALKMCHIPFIQTMNWDAVSTSYKTCDADSKAIVFSSKE